jgi:hypothetical protein
MGVATRAYNLIITPTSVTESTATIIDQIITNISAQCYSADVINSLLPDHYEQCNTINMTLPQQIKCFEEIGTVSEANITGPLMQNETWIDVIQKHYMDKNRFLL